MGIVFRQSVKATIINFSGAFLGALVVYCSTRYLSAIEYGINKNIINIGAVAQFFVLLGVANTVYNFTQRYANNPEKRKVLFTISLITPIVTVALLLIPYALFKKQLINIYKPGDRHYVAAFYFYVPVLVLLWSTITTLELYLWAHVKVAITSFFKEIILRLLNLLLLGLFIFNYISFHFFIISIVFSYAVSIIGLSIVIMRSGYWGISFKWKAFSLKEYAELISFSWYHLLLGLSINLIGFIDALMLAPYSGMSVVAVYTTAIYLATLLYLPYRAMSSASFAMLNESFIENDMVKLKDLFHRSSINILIAAIGMTIILGDNLINVTRILPPAYKDIVPIAIILMLGRLIDMATGLNNELMSISKYYKISFRISVTLIVMLIGFYLLLIPKYGIYGAAWGSTLALAIFNVLKMTYLWKKLRIQPFTPQTLLVLLAGAIACVIGFFSPFIINPYVDAVIRTAIIAVIYLVLLIVLKPSKDLTTYLQSIKTNKKIF